MHTPVTVSKPSRSASGTVMSTKAIVLSPMPKTAPPSENSVIDTGTTSHFPQPCPIESTAQASSRSSAPVPSITPKAPPRSSTNAMMSALSVKPAIGASAALPKAVRASSRIGPFSVDPSAG